MRQVVQSKYEPREWAIPFHARSALYAAMVCHRRAGKTVACINDLIDKAMQNHLPMPMYGYIAPLYKQAKTIAWRYLKLFTKEISVKVMESELSVELINGAIIRLFGADNPDALRGLYFDGVILDEYAQMQPRLFGEVIAPTLVDRRGWVVFIGTPAGMNHFYEMWDEAANDPEWFTLMLKASESGIIDPVDLERLKHLPGSDEDTFNQEFECDFHAANRGAYYARQINQLETTHCGIFPYDPDRQVLTFWDIGHTDDTSIWFGQTDGETFRIIDFFSESGYSVDSCLDMLADKPYVYGMGYLPHDAKNKSFQTGKSTRELMWERKFQLTIVPNLSVQDGIQAVRKTLPRVYFNTANPKVKEGVNALKMYSREWDDMKQVYKNVPLHNWASHPADAFRMFALSMNPQAVKTGAKSPTKVVPEATSKLLCLDNLFADREKAPRSHRV